MHSLADNGILPEWKVESMRDFIVGAFRVVSVSAETHTARYAGPLLITVGSVMPVDMVPCLYD